MIVPIVLAVIGILFVLRGLVVVPNGQVFVIERLGRVSRTLPPGLGFVLPFIDRVAGRYNVANPDPLSVDAQVITHDNTTVDVKGTIKYEILDAQLIHQSVPDVIGAVRQVTSTALRNEAGKRSAAEMREESRAFRSDVVRAANAIAAQLHLKIIDVEIAR